jgi:hypothetical protein
MNNAIHTTEMPDEVSVHLIAAMLGKTVTRAVAQDKELMVEFSDGICLALDRPEGGLVFSGAMH